MPYLSKKRAWTQQPQHVAPIDPRSSLSSGLVHAWALNVSGDTLTDNVGNSNGTLNTGNSWKLDNAGYYLYALYQTTLGNDAIAVGDSSGSAFPKTDDFTYSFFVRYSTIGAGKTLELFGGAGGSNGALNIRLDNTGQLQFIKQGQVYIGGSSTYVSANTWTHCAVVRTATDVKFYIDGNLTNTVTTTQNPNRNVQGYLFRGFDSNYDAAELRAPLVFESAKSAAEILALRDNSWQVFKRQDNRLWIPSASGGVHTTTSILTSDVATISGTSLHKILHTVVGNLTSSAATLTGTSVHTTPSPTHNTVGVLSASNSSITGIAARYREHQTTGILTTTNATINGTTNNFSVITSTGVLSSNVATLAGVMSITPAPGIHISTGVLQSNSSTITGILTHTATGHTLTGTLVSSVATLNGNVAHNTIHSSSGTLVSNVATINGTTSSSGVITLTPADIEAIANAVWQHPWALTLPKWLALK